LIARLLVANRGEIARRIARTAATMGIQTVAVYAEGDAGEPFVDELDIAVPLRGRTASETYLNIEALIEAAKRTGADAIHPGYGFLSERAAFARAVISAGLTWVGPPPDVIHVMGDKLAAKRLMAEAGVPVLPTWELGAGDVRFPVLVKAAAGGGGKGMRVVASESALDEHVASARREAAAAFGDETVFLERYVTEARHVEIQVLADAHGNAVHCFERECSIQRRHQKIIEESPSPAMDADLRDRMGTAALAAAKAVGYQNAGTVEFVVEPGGDFWFLEVNTRLQVEHPVTEAVTGLDLVREQLLVASGYPLSFDQSDLSINGHAIEARLYAEDPAAGFLPATGSLLDWEPAAQPAVRWDSGVERGSTVGVDFDPMLAKVIAHAPTRREAAQQLALALERTRIRGVTTNRDFLVAALRNDAFLAGDTTTSFIDRSGVPLSRPVTSEELRIACVGAALADRAEVMASRTVLRSFPAGWRNTPMPPESRVYLHDGNEVEVKYRPNRDGTLDFDGRTVLLRSIEGGFIEFEEAEDAESSRPQSRHRLHVLRNGDSVWVQGPEGDVRLAVRPRFPEAAREAVVPGGLTAPMPGKVISVNVRSGDRVDEGDVLMIVEAMKMEHRVLAPHRGTVGEVRAHLGDQVNGGDLLVVIEEVE
jgi:propionyl-CoA carboxylase alpha chain